MDYKYIEQLMERYFQCETTLEEESILRTFFSQENVPAALLPYRDLFVYEHEEHNTEHLTEEFDERILALLDEDQPRVKAHIITMEQRLRPLLRAVAVVAIILTIGLAAQMPYEKQATIDAEQFAAQHAKDTATIAKPAMALADSAANSKTTMDIQEKLQ